MKKIALTIIFFLLLILTACNNGTSIKNLENELQEIQSNLEDKDSKIKELEEMIEKLNEENQKHIASNNDLLSKLNLLNDSLALQNDKLDKQENEISDLNDHILALIEEANALKNQIQIFLENNEKLNLEIINIKDQLNQANRHIAELQIKIFNINLIQIEDTTSVIVDFDNLLLNLADGSEFKHVNLIIRHPLADASGKEDILLTINELTNNETIELPYHGKFEVDIEYVYDNLTLSVNYNETKQLIIAANNVNIAWLNATMPLLYFMADVYLGEYDNGHTYMEIERTATFDYNHLPSNVKKAPLFASPSNGNYTQTQVPNFFDSVNPQSNKSYMLDWIEELYSINNNTQFKFAGVDNYPMFITGVYYTNVPLENFEVVVYTDGSVTTTILNNGYGGNYGLQNFNLRKEYVADWINKTEKNEYQLLEPMNILAATEVTNFSYVLSAQTGLNFNQEMQNKFNTLKNVKVVSLSDAFNNIDNAGKLNNLEFLLKTRWGVEENQSMSVYFEGQPSKNLLILGTSLTGEVNNLFATFEDYINYIIETYGTEYKIFYKGHPRFPSSAERVELFNELNVVELPNSIPVETLMLLYPEVYVGGYTSTSFQSSKIDQTIFFFGTKQYIEYNATLKNMIAEGVVFANTVYLTVDQDGNVIALSN